MSDRSRCSEKNWCDWKKNRNFRYRMEQQRKIHLLPKTASSKSKRLQKPSLHSAEISKKKIRSEEQLQLDFFRNSNPTGPKPYKIHVIHQNEISILASLFSKTLHST